MKNVYLTEKQYVDYVLYEYTNYGILDESTFNIERLFNLLYRGCKTFKDYTRRTMYVAAAGVISFTMLCSIINKCVPVSQEEKESLITQVENIAPSKDDDKEPVKRENVINLNFRISENGINHIKQYEKCRLEPYFATKKEKAKGIKTIGWGHKITSKDPVWLKNAKSITQQQADELFKHDIKIYEHELAQAFKTLPKHLQNVNLYPQGFIDACISLIYNCGRKNLKDSPFFVTLGNCSLDKNGNINKNDYIYACSKIKESCITQQGEVMDGLVKRRYQECLMAQQ